MKKRKNKKIKSLPTSKIQSFNPQELFDRGHYEKAARLLKMQLANESNDNDYRLLGKCLFKTKKYNETMETLLQVKSKDYGEFLNIGLCNSCLEKYHEAVKYYEESLKINQTSEAYFLLGDAQYQLGQLDKAENSFKQCLKHDPDDAETLNVLSSILIKLEKWNDVVKCLEGYLKNNKESSELYFALAFAQSKLKQLDKAENSYRKYLKHYPNNVNGLYNLSIILDIKGKLEEAQELCNRAVTHAPDDEKIVKWRLTIKDKLGKLVKQKNKQEDFLKTAPERWYQVDQYKRQLLSALTVINGFEGWEHLSKVSGIDEKYIPGHWRKLIELGMIVDSNEGYSINEHVADLVKRERLHSIVTRIIHADSTVAFKPIFNSRLEYLIYNLLIGLFPNHLVFPNMSLQSIFTYDRMKDILEKPDDFRYYLMSHVDFCITSTSNYLPIIAFELDSRFHDSSDQLERDDKKDRIFQLGGVPLLRLRALGRPTEQVMRQQIIESVRLLGEELTTTNQKFNAYISQEIDYGRFGIQYDEVFL